MKIDIVLAGVGGQGILSIATILGAAALKENLYIKQAEVHGMSQRGGSVVTYVRYGEKVYSPLIEDGEADFIVSFEKIEAARWLSCLKPDGKVIVNTQKIDPMSVVIGDCEYPEGVLDSVRAAGAAVVELDALPLAVEAGSPKATNVVLIGAMAKNTDIPKEIWLDAVKSCVPAKFLEMNLKAFELGYNK